MMTYKQARNLPRYQAIQDRTLKGLIEYVEFHQQPGHFLTAVLSNNLFDACAHGDSIHVTCLSSLVDFIYNYVVPSNCYGTPERVHQWLNLTTSVQPK